jgi:hypothetical protein
MGGGSSLTIEYIKAGAVNDYRDARYSNVQLA